MEKVIIRVMFSIQNTVLEFAVDWEANLKGLFLECAKASNLENGGLYMPSKDGEFMLNEEILVSSVLQVLGDSNLLIYKRKPNLVKVLFVQHLYVDSDSSIGAIVEEAKKLIATKKDYSPYVKSDPTKSPENFRLKNIKDKKTLQGFEGIENFKDFKKIPLKNSIAVSTVSDDNPYIIVECNTEEKPPSISNNNNANGTKKAKSLKIKATKRRSLSHSNSKKISVTHLNINNNIENPPINIDEAQKEPVELRENFAELKEEKKNKLKTLRRHTSSAMGIIRKSSSSFNISLNEITPTGQSITHSQTILSPSTFIAPKPKLLFGSSLSSAPLTNSVPDIILSLISHLEKNGAIETEGIFRICATQQKLDQCIEYIEERGGVEVEFGQFDIHTVANTLKSYLRLLPNPLIDHDLYPRFMAAVCLEDEIIRNNYFNTIINSLPEVNKETLFVLLQFLRKIADNHKANKMSERNLSIVFGPLLLRKEGDDVKSFLQYSNYIIKSATNLIESFAKLFVAGEPIRTITSTFDHIAEKPGELDLKKNSVIHIFMREGEDWLGETSGRFATFSQKYIDKTLNYVANNNNNNNSEESSSSSSEDLSDVLVRANKKNAKKKQKSMMNEEEFQKIFQCTREIFVLLPKWKQDSLLKSAGLLEGNIKVEEKRKFQARTIPVGSNSMKSQGNIDISSSFSDSSNENLLLDSFTATPTDSPNNNNKTVNFN